MSQPVREDEEGVVLSPTIVLPKAVQLAMRHLKVTGFTWQPG